MTTAWLISSDSHIFEIKLELLIREPFSVFCHYVKDLCVFSGKMIMLLEVTSLFISTLHKCHEHPTTNTIFTSIKTKEEKKDTEDKATQTEICELKPSKRKREITKVTYTKKAKRETYLGITLPDEDDIAAWEDLMGIYT
jgi:hypothetical protein